MDLPPILDKQLGPFPLVGWLGIGAAGVGLAVLIRRSSLFDTKPEPDLAAADPAATVAGSYYMPTAAGGTSAAGNQPPTPTATPWAPATNSEWARAAINKLIASGFDPIVAGAGIENYMQGAALDARQSAAVSAALAALGAPPDGAPPIQGVPAPAPQLAAAPPPRTPAGGGAAPAVAAAHGSESQVVAIFQQVLGRPPDTAGLAYWSELLRTGRYSPAQIAAAIAATPEGQKKQSTGGGGPEAQVAAIFQSVLGRPPDTAGLAYWSELLRTGRYTPAQISAAIAATPEAQKRRAA